MTHRHSTALAALLALSLDLPAFAQEAVSGGQGSSVADWSGYYLGVSLAIPQGGNSWRQISTDLELIPGGWEGSMLSLGLGHDWQRGRLTYGLRMDFAGGTYEARPQNDVFINCPECATQADNILTMTGRIGLASGKYRVFAEGGWARASVTATNLFGLLTYADTDMTGWSLAAGAERQIGDRLSLTLRYDHIDLGTLPLPDYLTGGETQVEISRVQVGMTARW